MRDALAIMARTPRRNATKTRLQSELGTEGALHAHIQLVEATLTRMSALQGVSVSLWVTEFDDTARAWSDLGKWPLSVQPPGDLGTRMHDILQRLLDQGAEQACLIGTDCPQIDAAYVQGAFTALALADVVIGPAEDGGYGLIGLREPQAELFRDVPWGSSDVLEVTLARAESAGLNTALLPVVWDVDTPDDWQRYLEWVAHGSSRGS